MQRTTASTLLTPARLTKWIFLAFVLWIGWHILAPYPEYMPPNFDTGFLRGKKSFFYRTGYGVGFFAHIFAAPPVLFLGAIQSSRTLRVQKPALHRGVGQAYCFLTLAFVAPGGLLIAMRAYGGSWGICCFSLIAISTWVSTLMGWRSARVSQYAAHARWMLRSYTLILSAIFLRLINISLSSFELGHEFTYQISAWMSWLIPWAVLEIAFFTQKTTKPEKNLMVDG